MMYAGANWSLPFANDLPGLAATFVSALSRLVGCLFGSGNTATEGNGSASLVVLKLVQSGLDLLHLFEERPSDQAVIKVEEQFTIPLQTTP